MNGAILGKRLTDSIVGPMPLACQLLGCDLLKIATASIYGHIISEEGRTVDQISLENGLTIHEYL